jgi:hypothetical protein
MNKNRKRYKGKYRKSVKTGKFNVTELQTN